MNAIKPTLGEFIPDEAPATRDAIHMSVAPAVAGEDLKPGTHVGLTLSGVAVTDSAYMKASLGKPVGIVDPFMRHTVREGKRFYILLYPGTITNLRHEWNHPAFDAVAEQQRQEEIEAGIALATDSGKAEESEEDDGCRGCNG